MQETHFKKHIAAVILPHEGEIHNRALNRRPDMLCLSSRMKTHALRVVFWLPEDLTRDAEIPRCWPIHYAHDLSARAEQFNSLICLSPRSTPRTMRDCACKRFFFGDMYMYYTYRKESYYLCMQAAANSTSQEWSRDFEWSSRVKSLLVDKFKLSTFRPLQVYIYIYIYIYIYAVNFQATAGM
jgi:hypothetical protein